MKHDIVSLVWIICYEDDPPPKDPPPKDPPPKDPPSEEDLKLSDKQQKHVNSIIAKEKRKYQDETKTILAEMEALKKKAKLTKKEKEEYEEKVTQLRQSVMTKEELARETQTKLSDDYEKKLKDSQEESISWKQKYTTSTIKRAITDAAVVSKAYNPEQIVEILQQKTQLVEVLDEDGKPTGETKPEVDFAAKDKDGKMINLKLTVDEVMKKMKEDERYLNLFVDATSGGLGSINRDKVGGTDYTAEDIAKMSQEQYEKLREENKIKI